MQSRPFVLIPSLSGHWIRLNSAKFAMYTEELFLLWPQPSRCPEDGIESELETCLGLLPSTEAC
jgi:hypothetical protein